MGYFVFVLFGGAFVYLFYRLKILENTINVGRLNRTVLDSNDFWLVTLDVNPLNYTYAIHTKKYEPGVPDDIAIHKYRYNGENILTRLIDDYEEDIVKNHRCYNVVDSVVLEDEIRERNESLPHATEEMIRDLKAATVWNTLTDGKIKKALSSVGTQKRGEK